MNNLEYKGRKSTRLLLTVLTYALATLFFVSGTLTAAEWIDIAKWALGIYATSEAAAKGAEAYRDHPRQ